MAVVVVVSSRAVFVFVSLVSSSMSHCSTVEAVMSNNNHAQSHITIAYRPQYPILCGPEKKHNKRNNKKKGHTQL